MKYSIYRGTVVIANVFLNGSWISRVMGEDIAQTSWKLSSLIEFRRGDHIFRNGRQYNLSGRPSITQISTLQYDYTANFEADSAYSLIDTQYFMYDQDNALTLSEFALTGKPLVFLDLLIKNANRRSPGWSLGTVDDGDAVTMQFSDDDNCRTVLTKLAEQFKTEFYIDGKTINFSKQGRATGLNFEYGHGKGLYEVRALTPDDFQIITKLYYFGGSQNLPIGYRKNSAGVASRKLMGSARFIMADAATIAKYGVIERSKTFADIIPQREGVVSAVGPKTTSKTTIVFDNSLNFDIEALKQPGITAKISFTTGLLAGYDFEINNYNSVTKAIEFNPDTNETAFGAEGLPNQFLNPAVGDKYVLYDLQMPAAYVTDAENRLDAKALELLSKSKEKPIKCEVVCSPAFIEANKLYDIRSGDFCTITSPVLNGIVNIRIVGINIDLQDPRKITLELADEVTITSIIRNIIEQDHVKNVINLNKLYDVNRARRNARTTSELQNFVVDPDGNYYPEKIRAGSIETLYLSVGAKATNFSLRGVGFEANSGGDHSVFDISAGQLVHFALDIPGVGFVWDMSARKFTGLDPATTYYVYARVSRTSLVGTWVISSGIITAEQENGFWNLQSGVLFSVVEGRRDHEFTKGMTFIIGDQIKAGMLMDISGLNFFNLTDGKFNLGDITSGMDFGVTVPGQLTVRGGVVSKKLIVGYGDYFSAIGDEGAFPLFIGASSLTAPDQAKFRVARDGTLYASGGNFSGKIIAGPGSQIGDVVISGDNKFQLAGTKVIIKPDEQIKIFNGGIADFSGASKLTIPTQSPTLTPGQAAIWIDGLSGLTNDPSGYVLPTATTSILGGVKIGSGLIINPTTGVVSVNGDIFDLTNYYTKAQSDARYTFVGGANASGTWGINITGNAATSSLSANSNQLKGYGFDVSNAYGSGFDLILGRSASINEVRLITQVGMQNFVGTNNGSTLNNSIAGKASYVDNSGISMKFNWVGQSFQPAWIWGGDMASEMYVYNPANFSVNNSQKWAGNGYDGSGAFFDTPLYAMVHDGANWRPGGHESLIKFLSLGKGGRYHQESGTFGLDADTAPFNSSGFSYALNAPYNGFLGTFASNYGMQFNSNYLSGDRLAFRTINGDNGTRNAWRNLIWNGYNDTVTLAGGVGTSYTTANLEIIRGAGAQSPNISFHWAGVVASQIAVGSDGAIEIRNNPGSGYENFRAKNIVSSDSIYAASAISAAGVIATDTHFRTNSSVSMVGNYAIAAEADKIIWTIGANWTSLLNYYGIGYEYEKKSGFAHTINFANAGTVTSRISLSTGAFWNRGAIYTQAIQSNNFVQGEFSGSGFRVDQNGDAELSSSTVRNWIKAGTHITALGVISAPIIKATSALKIPTTAPTLAPGEAAIWIDNLSGITT